MFATTSKSKHLQGEMEQNPVRPINKVGQGPGTSGTSTRKLTRERWQAIGILVLFGALIGFLLYLASLSGTVYPGGNTGYEFWMMP